MAATLEVDWSNLPKELLHLIGNFLQTHVGVTLFRSVCSSWRSSLPPYRLPPPPSPLPRNFTSSSSSSSSSSFDLHVITTYLVGPTTSSSSSSDHHHPNVDDPFLLKLQHNPVTGESRLLHPLTLSPLIPSNPNNSSPSPTRKTFSLLDFNIVELRRSYVSVDDDGFFNRTVVMPCQFTDYSEVSAIFMICFQATLAFARFGDDKLTQFGREHNNGGYDDFALYKGQCYVVDKQGTISWISSSGDDELKVVQFSHSLGRFGGKKYVLEFEGDLHVVDQYIGKESYYANNNVNSNLNSIIRYQNPDNKPLIVPLNIGEGFSESQTSGFRVYKLDQEWGRWVEVKDLGDWVFVLSIKDGSFAVSSREFGRGVKGNCILFSELPVGFPFCNSKELQSCVFSLDDGKVSKLLPCHSQMVQQPSSWLAPD